MKRTSIVGLLAGLLLMASASCAQNPPPPNATSPQAPAVAQAPAPAPVAPVAGQAPAVAQTPYNGVTTTENGTVRLIVYGMQGEFQALVLRNDKVISLPPDLGAQLQAGLTQGSSISVTGVSQLFGRQRQLLAQSLRLNGQTFAAAAPGAAPPPPAAGAPPPPPPGAPPAPGVAPAPAPSAAPAPPPQ